MGVSGDTELLDPVKPILHDAFNVTDEVEPLPHSK